MPTDRRQATVTRIVFCVILATISASLQSLQLPLPRPRPQQAEAVRFAAIGDMGTGTALQYDVAAMMETFRRRVPFEFAITLGDNIYGGQRPGDLRDKFELPYKALLDAGVMFYASLGNHDSPNQRVYKPFNMHGEQYYTFTKGHVDFFALDSNYMNPPQLAWLDRALGKSGADWKIAYFHHPLYSSSTFHGSAVELRLLLEPLFVKYGVQVVFAGHDHVYERVKPQKGIVYFIEGASGQLRKGNLKKDTSLTAAGFDEDLSFLLIAIDGDVLTYQAISRTGATVDEGVIMRAAKSG